MESNENILDIFENDAIFKRFIEDDGDAKEPSSRVVQGLAVSHQLAKLAEGIGMLNHELHSQVSEHYEDLLSQATGIETLEGVLDMMQTRIQSILASTDQIRNRVTEPYEKIKQRTRELCRLQDACDLFRTLIRILHLSSRLRGQLKGKEIAKAAQVIQELDQLCGSVDLNGIEIFEKDRAFFCESRSDVQRDANRMLKVGLDTQSQTQVATALQVFHNLGALKSTVSDIVGDQEKHLSDEIDESIDVQRITSSISGKSPTQTTSGPGRVSMPSVGNTAAFRAALWTSIGQLMEKIVNRTSLIHHLKRVLDMKKDATSHQSFSQILSSCHGDIDKFNPLFTFWEKITSKLSSAFNEAAENNTFLKQAFESEFPQLLRIINDLWIQIRHFIKYDTTYGTTPIKSESSLTDQENKIPCEEQQMLRSSLANFERSYLTRSLASLFDPINLVFSNTVTGGGSSGSASSAVPCQDDIDALLKTISNELRIASIDANLSLTVSRNVGKTLQLFVVKSEQLLISDGEASQVIGPPTNGQIMNVAIVNSLYRLHSSIEIIVKDLKDFPDTAIEYIVSSLRGVVDLMGSALQPLLGSVSDAVEAIILTMHNEDFAESTEDGGERDDDQTSVPCSLYMKELKDFISRVATTYVPLYDCIDFIYDQTLPIAQRCVDLFVRHATLIRPLSKIGKLRLAADFANVEHAVAPLVRNISELGDSYRLLRAIRPMLFESNEHIQSSATLLNGVIPSSVVLHMLFSRAPVELRSPNQISGWSASRYSLWMDNHDSEADRLKLIKGALETYARTVEQEGGTNYAPVYPVMLAIIEKSTIAASTD